VSITLVVPGRESERRANLNRGRWQGNGGTEREAEGNPAYQRQAVRVASMTNVASAPMRQLSSRGTGVVRGAALCWNAVAG
jgi:hypothetical protein